MLGMTSFFFASVISVQAPIFSPWHLVSNSVMLWSQHTKHRSQNFTKKLNRTPLKNGPLASLKGNRNQWVKFFPGVKCYNYKQMTSMENCHPLCQMPSHAHVLNSAYSWAEFMQDCAEISMQELEPNLMGPPEKKNCSPLLPTHAKIWNESVQVSRSHPQKQDLTAWKP